MLTMLQRMLAGEIAPPPIARLLGMKLEEVSPGGAVMSMQTDLSKHANPRGTLHGGIFCDLADAAMGLAYATELSDDEAFTTVELKINFFRPVWTTRLRARGKVIRHGRTIGFAECEVFDGDGKLVAKASSTLMTLRGAQAIGR